MIVSALLTGVALADKPDRLRPADCEPLDETEFRGLVLDAQSAIDRDDATLHASIVGEIDARLPCLDFAPPPRLWADYLVGIAIAEFAKRGDWQTPLGAAVRIRPGIDRGVGAGHPMARWEPEAEAPPAAGPLPPGVTLWVDGVLAAELPPLAGLHLVQRERDDTWVTLLVRDEAIPPTWLAAEIVRPPEVTFDAQIGGLLNVGGAIQSRTGFASDYIPEGEFGLGGVGAGGRIVARYGSVALLGELSGGFPALRRFALDEAQVAVGLHSGRLTVGAGLGLVGICALEGAQTPSDATLRWFVVPELSGMATWFPNNGKWRFGASVSGGRSSWRVEEWAARPLGVGDWYYGGAVTTTNAVFKQPGRALDDRRVTTGATIASLEIGTRLGGSSR